MTNLATFCVMALFDVLIDGQQTFFGVGSLVRLLVTSLMDDSLRTR